MGWFNPTLIRVNWSPSACLFRFLNPNPGWFQLVMDCDVILLLIFTGQTHEDRRQALEKLGISVQSSGIKVQMSPINLLSG